MREPTSIRERVMLGIINPFVEYELKSAIADFAANGCPAPRVLDVGCGAQPYRKYIEALGARYYSLDVSPRGVALDYEVAIDSPQLPEIVHDRFDLLLLTEVLEHVDKTESAWSNISHLAADRSIVVVTAPFVYPLHEEPWDAARPTIHSLARMAKSAGFSTRRISTAGSCSAVLALVLASFSPKPEASLLLKAAAYGLHLVTRAVAMSISKVPVFDLLQSGIYVSNLAVFSRGMNVYS